MPVWELCRAADEQITAGCAAVFQSLKNKGVAFPTCIARNNCAGHYSPLEEDSEVLAEGDVVKVYVLWPRRVHLLHGMASSPYPLALVRKFTKHCAGIWARILMD